jgi:hypothetical protein
MREERKFFIACTPSTNMISTRFFAISQVNVEEALDLLLARLSGSYAGHIFTKGHLTEDQAADLFDQNFDAYHHELTGFLWGKGLNIHFFL